MRHVSFSLAVVLALVGCSNDDDGPDYEQTCTDPEYGDGGCHLDLACGVPDIDCFQEFEDDEEAAEYPIFSLGGGGETLGPDDPRYQRARRISDRVWERIPQMMAIDALAVAHLGVVVLDNPLPNAFVAPALGERMALAIAFTSGILDEEISDDAITSVTAHELGHMLELHAFPEAREGIEKYYVVPAGQNEPLGIDQPDDPRLRPLVTPWMESANVVGGDRRQIAADLPIGGALASKYHILASNYDNLAGGCAALGLDYAAAFGAAAVDLDINDVPRLADPELTALRTAFDAFADCMSTEPLTLRELDAATLIAGLNLAFDADEDVFAEMNISAGVDGYLASRRADVAQREADFQASIGVPWSSFRYYSMEEQADDFAGDYTRIDPLSEPGVATGMAALMGDRLAECDEARTANAVPYGTNVNDPHHGTCWRRDHAFRYDAGAQRRKARVARGTPFRLTKPADMDRIY